MAPYTHSTNTTEVSAATNDNVFLFDTVNSKDGSVVFHNSQGNDLLEVSAQNDFVSYARPHQLVQISTSKTRLQLQAPPVNVSQARQDAKTNIFTAALLEHICCLYVSNPRQRRQVLEELCSKLSEGGIISPVAFLDIFSAPRKQYQLGFSKLMEAVVDMVNKDPNTAVTPVQTPILAEDEARCVALIATPPVAPLMRIPSDPLSSFFTSRYSSDFNEIKSIGSGGFGSVYMVKNKLDEVFYAVKKVRLKQINHEKCKKLLREVKVLATLNHSSIVRYNSAWMEQQPDDMVIENISNETEDSS
ncbi:EIF2AK1 [Bugula neritina]|nr:EIF2AK1 [Bugula neritina]